MRFYADLHVHSKYSRATSRNLDVEHLTLWAARKGIRVLGTGDFTHPAWMKEIRGKLEAAEPGLFRPSDAVLGDIARHYGRVPGLDDVRFMLEVEISTIYKKDEKVRKVHHLLYAPDLEKADRITERLGRIGNLRSDGRPILGLDSRHLLEITLEGGDGCFLIPAHIWTPWFSALGSKSGFDSIDACYGDLARHIFAVETGLSSDPPMNWRLSALDRYTLVSNSDAHSPTKLGREASRFHTEPDYFSIQRALETGDGFSGTVEFFPEEGKYHQDGHRKCGVRLDPEESRRLGNQCPECGTPLTIGVLNRVGELADRAEGRPPAGAAGFESFVPLNEVLGELLGAGPDTKGVNQAYERLLSRVGPELFILGEASLDDLRGEGPPLLDEALRRMRAGDVIRNGGFDGEYGTIKLFAEGELSRAKAVASLFEFPSAEAGPSRATPGPAVVRVVPRTFASARDSTSPPTNTSPPEEDGSALTGLDPDQRRAGGITSGPLLIIAGPGTGKTRTLTRRLAHLVLDQGVAPSRCLAITFTRRAAAEMRERLEALVPDGAGQGVTITTFHGLGLTLLRENHALVGMPGELRVASEHERADLLAGGMGIPPSKARNLLERLLRSVPGGVDAEDSELGRAREVYRRLMRGRGWVDFDDLIELSAHLLEDHPEVARSYRERFHHVSVDEFQDVDARQYRLLRALAPQSGEDGGAGSLCVIGDPDQSIYGFRGSDAGIFARFTEDYPDAAVVQLGRNYRSSRPILEGALRMMSTDSLVRDRRIEALLDHPERIEVHECPTERAEAEFVVRAIERMMGGSTFFSFDSRRVEGHEAAQRAFGDFAVLYRTGTQSDALAEALSRAGIPFQRRSHGALAEHPVVARLLKERAARPSETALAERVEAFRTDLLDGPVEECPDTDSLAVLNALRPIAVRAGNDPERFVSELVLETEADLWDPRAEKVSLLTLHASKGLEFPVVFIAGCEDGLLPLRWSAAHEGDVAEERRLFFVGMTRAREKLMLSWAAHRARHGKVEPRVSSPFLRDIEDALRERHREKGAARHSASAAQTELF